MFCLDFVLNLEVYDKVHPQMTPFWVTLLYKDELLKRFEQLHFSFLFSHASPHFANQLA